MVTIVVKSVNLGRRFDLVLDHKEKGFKTILKEKQRTKKLLVLLIYIFTCSFQNEFQVIYMKMCNSNGLKKKEKIQ